MTEKERGLGYLRVSSPEQAEAFGLDVQERQVKQIAESRSIILDVIIRDEGISGGIPDRAGINELFRKLDGGGYKFVIASRVSRFGSWA